MTTQELIEKLQQFPPDTRVVIPGYEGGLNDVGDLEEIEIYLNYNTSSYYGPHEEVNDYTTEFNYNKCEKAQAIKLS